MNNKPVIWLGLELYMAVASFESKAREVEIQIPSLGRRQRVQLDFTPEAYDRLKQIRERAGSISNGDVIRKALQLYEWFLMQRESGAHLQVVKDGKTSDVEVL